MNSQQLIEVEGNLTDQLNRHVEAGIRNNISRGHNNAGDIGFECDSYQALCRLRGELKPRNSVGLAKIFRIGNVWEQPNIRWLQDAQIKVRETGDKRFEWKKYNIVGYMEADIKLPEIDEKACFPLEHKTISPNGLRAVRKCKEEGMSLTQATQPWIKKYPGQLMTYMLFKEVEIGVWFFFEKLSGDFLWWLTALDYGYTETLIKRAERCEKNVREGTIPKPEYSGLCSKCDFAMTYCFPDKDFGPGFDFINDEAIEEKLIRREELKEARSEYERLDKEIRGAFKGKNAVVGDFKIESKEVERKGYTVEPSSYWKTTIERL